MNLYLIPFVPNVKSKICRLLGAASAKDFERLIKKITHLEHKMERMDSQLRRIQRRQMLSEVEEQKTVEADVVKDKKPKAAPRPTVSKATLKPERVPSVAAAKSSAKVTRLAAAAPRRAEPAPAVMLLGTDSEVRESVRDYFGGETPLLEVETFAEIPATAEAKNVAAVFFDRAWLAEPEARQALLRLSGRLPQRPMVGISSYLTLSVARAAPDGSEFAAFLTKPLSPDALAGVLSDKKRQEAIS